MVTGGVALAGAAAAYQFQHLFGRNSPIVGSRLGPLQKDPAGIVNLPAGFSYKILERALQPMSDGFLVPGRPDGMACFTTSTGTWCLMRNHELGRLSSEADYLLGKSVPDAYRMGVYGGVSRLELEPTTLRRLGSQLILTGTDRNCAGGISPWGWLSCEESVESEHGFVFLCSHEAKGLQPARRIEAYGRCRHEAATVDPQTHIAYLTEDELDSCVYRFVPHAMERPFEEGRLQALAIVGRPALDLGKGLSVAERLQVHWVDVPGGPLAPSKSLRSQARGVGAALIRRGEGLWLSGQKLYFSSTNGGPVGAGQIFELDLSEPQTLTLLAQSESRASLDMPDNLTVSPGGGIYLAEDGYGVQFIRGLSADGSLFDVAENAVSSSEFAGICFSPDGRVLFANIQEDGITLAIEGPFPS